MRQSAFFGATPPAIVRLESCKPKRLPCATGARPRGARNAARFSAVGVFRKGEASPEKSRRIELDRHVGGER